MITCVVTRRDINVEIGGSLTHPGIAVWRRVEERQITDLVIAALREVIAQVLLTASQYADGKLFCLCP